MMSCPPYQPANAAPATPNALHDTSVANAFCGSKGFSCARFSGSVVVYLWICNAIYSTTNPRIANTTGTIHGAPTNGKPEISPYFANPIPASNPNAAART